MAMQPLSSLDDSTLRGVLAVACDCDDTLTTQGVLDAQSLAALHRLARQDIPCVIATGRPVGWASVLARVLPVRGVVAENGHAWLVRRGERLDAEFDVEPEQRARDLERIAACVAQLRAQFPELAPVPDLTLRATDVALDVGEAQRVPDGIVQAALKHVRSVGLHAIASSVHLHVSAHPPDKVLGLERLARALGLDAASVRTRWIYVGDSPNDARAFADMQLSVGVANVRDFVGRIDALPRYVTAASRGAGFAELVERLCIARAPAVQPDPR